MEIQVALPVSHGVWGQRLKGMMLLMPYSIFKSPAAPTEQEKQE